MANLNEDHGGISIFIIFGKISAFFEDPGQILALLMNFGNKLAFLYIRRSFGKYHIFG